MIFVIYTVIVYSLVLIECSLKCTLYRLRTFIVSTTLLSPALLSKTYFSLGYYRATRQQNEVKAFHFKFGVVGKRIVCGKWNTIDTPTKRIKHTFSFEHFLLIAVSYFGQSYKKIVSQRVANHVNAIYYEILITYLSQLYLSASGGKDRHAG